MLFDLSAVTDSLLELVKSSWSSAPLWAELNQTHPTFTPTITGLAPEAIRLGDGPQLSLFLYHVESDNAHESSFWSPQMLRSPGPPVRYLPFALDLYYLLSAYSENSYAQEQQAMSVALRLFHDNPVVRAGTSPPSWDLKLTLEHRSYNELSTLWQATTAPLRLGVVYRAAVVFIAPDEPVGAAREVEIVNILVDGSDVQITSPPSSPPAPIP